MTALPLASVLDTSAADPLRRDLLATIVAGRPVLLDGSHVDRVGLACLQVLASARISAATAGLDFAVRAPSLAFSTMAKLADVDLPESAR